MLYDTRATRTDRLRVYKITEMQLMPLPHIIKRNSHAGRHPGSVMIFLVEAALVAARPFQMGRVHVSTEYVTCI